MERDGLRGARRLRVAGLAVVVVVLLGTGLALPGHNTPPPPLPEGHGWVLVRLLRTPGEREAVPNGQVPLEAVAVHRAGAGQGEQWVPLPVLRPEFSARELESGQVWLATAAILAGVFDRIRLGAAEVPIAVRLLPGESIIVSLEVSVEVGRAAGPPRLRLKRVRPVGS